MIPVHDTALSFFRRAVFYQCGKNAVFIAAQILAIQRGAVIIHVAPVIFFEEVCGQRHVQLHGGGFGSYQSEAVLAGDEAKGATVVPFHVESTPIIDVNQCSHRTRFNGRIGIFHLCKPDPRAFGVLLPKELDEFSAEFLHIAFLLSLQKRPTSLEEADLAFIFFCVFPLFTLHHLLLVM